MEESPNPRKSVEVKASAEGKTVSDAYSLALKKLEEKVGGPFDREEAEVIVISEGSKGFLGMGAQVAKVEVRLAVDESLAPSAPDEEIAPEVAAERRAASAEAERRLRDYLEKVLAGMGLEGRIFVSEENEELVGKVDGDDLGLFIGRHGQTIDAIQYLANVIVYRKLADRRRIVIDAEDYRNRRLETLQSIAERAAGEVLNRGKRRYELKPMSAAERRVVHLHLQERKGVETTSEGDEPNRRVVVTRSGR